MHKELAPSGSTICLPNMPGFAARGQGLFRCGNCRNGSHPVATCPGVSVGVITAWSWSRLVMPSLGKERCKWDATVRGDNCSRWAISRLVRPWAASSMISRCCGVSACSPAALATAPGTAIPQARSSLAARWAQGRAASARNVSWAALRTSLAWLMRRCLRSHWPYSRRSCARSNGHSSPTGSLSTSSG
jgi:hypothetical protein